MATAAGRIGRATAQATPQADEGAVPADHRAQARFARLDRDVDGLVSREEFRVTREGIFRRLDANKDGKLTPEGAPGPRGRG